jgi:hypothetical protein
MFVFVPVFAGLLPHLDRMWLSRGAAELVARAGRQGPVDSVGFTEPSLVFLLGTGTRFVSAEEAVADLGRGRLALVGSRDEDDFARQAKARGIEPLRIGRVEGINYSNARRMALTLYGARPE